MSWHVIIYNELALDHRDNDDDSFFIVTESCELAENPQFLRQNRQVGAFYWGIRAKSLKIIESALLTVNCNG